MCLMCTHVCVRLGEGWADLITKKEEVKCHLQDDMPWSQSTESTEAEM